MGKYYFTCPISIRLVKLQGKSFLLKSIDFMRLIENWGALDQYHTMIKIDFNTEFA